MCLSCWSSEGRPFKVTDAVKKWAPAFEAANPYGALHIVIDDWNLGDRSIEICRADASPSEIELLDALKAMTREERWATAILAEDPNFIP